MLEKPAIPDESILACLQAEFGSQIAQLAFLPLGGDLSTAVYRAVADDGTPYFCKLKRGVFDEVSVELPRFLSEQGIPQIIPPLVTQIGRLWADLGEFRIILYPFVEGTSGFEVELSERQWADFGAALKRIHTLALPLHLSRKIRRESFSPEWREACQDILARLDGRTFDDPVTAQWADFLRPKRDTILDHIQRADRLAHPLAARPIEEVLCHSDIHPGNLFIARDETLFIVDWDYSMLAPKERDLMFIGGGQGYVNRTAEEEQTLFYRSYGEAAIDPLALAYYRYERNIMDITVECTRILSDALGDQDRAQSLQILTWLFMPGGSVELAYGSDRTS
jgi:spectinomycin phosphotransferase